MSEEQFMTLLNFFKVMGNESRLRLIGLLANQEQNVGELATALGIKEPTVSHHLNQLKSLNLVKMRAEGNNRIYSLNTRVLERMNKDMFTPENMASVVASAPSPEEKVLRTFMEGDQITAIPAKRAKQQVLARWLIDKFEHDRQYEEREVNEIIKRHNYDWAHWRRFMVEEHMMARAGGYYWRIDGP